RLFMVTREKSIQQADGNESIRLESSYRVVRQYSEYICEPLAIEDYVVQPTIDVSPPKWHLAHTTWFFEEFVLVPFYKNYSRFHPRYSFIFNSYYESYGSRVVRPNRGHLSRPTVEEVYQYRAYVDEHITWLLNELTPEAARLIEVGINHEQQHQELLYTDIKFILGNNPLFPPYRAEAKEHSFVEKNDRYISIEGGRYRIGHEGEGFAFDNEKAAHEVHLTPFEIRTGLVTNREYLYFIQDGGYQRPEYWLSDGWEWVQENGIDAPLYWHLIDG